jgi:hypothetical protein
MQNPDLGTQASVNLRCEYRQLCNWRRSVFTTPPASSSNRLLEITGVLLSPIRMSHLGEARCDLDHRFLLIRAVIAWESSVSSDKGIGGCDIL